MSADERVRLDPEAWAEGERSRRVAIKVGRTGRCTLAHPMAEAGEWPSGAVVWHVEGVPPVVTPAEVLEVFAATAGWRRGYRVRFDELGPGRLVR